VVASCKQPRGQAGISMAVQQKEEEKVEVEHRHRGLKRYGFSFFLMWSTPE